MIFVVQGVLKLALGLGGLGSKEWLKGGWQGFGGEPLVR